MGYFKYCGESGLLVLKNHQLKVTPPNEFNDPFEFSPVVCNPNPKEYAEKTVRKVITEPTFFEANRLAFSHLKNFQEFQTFARANIALMVNMLEADTPKLDKTLDILNTLSETSGVVCFSSDPLHPLMWAHYAEAHRGVVIEFDETADLFNSIAFLKVDYNAFRVGYNPDGTDQRQMVELFVKRKSKHWEYEQEFRLLVELSTTHKQVTGGKTMFLMDVEPAAIKSVTLGLRATGATRSEVLALSDNTPLKHLQIFEIQLHDTEFSFQRKRIK